MTLEDYKKKRSFSKTPEPTGGKSNDDKLHFVIPTTPHWVKPEHVANFKFATWTKNRKIRKLQHSRL